MDRHIEVVVLDLEPQFGVRPPHQLVHAPVVGRPVFGVAVFGVDPEHFGISLAYARDEISPAQAARVTKRRPGLDPATHANLVAATHSKFAPEETTKIENLSAVLKTVDDAAAITVKAYGDALVPVVGRDAAANAALSALKTGGQ